MINLKELRIQKGLTQDEVAKSIGVDRTTIVKIEMDNNYKPSPDTARGLGKLLDFEWFELFEN